MREFTENILAQIGQRCYPTSDATYAHSIMPVSPCRARRHASPNLAAAYACHPSQKLPYIIPGLDSTEGGYRRLQTHQPITQD